MSALTPAMVVKAARGLLAEKGVIFDSDIAPRLGAEHHEIRNMLNCHMGLRDRLEIMNGGPLNVQFVRSSVAVKYVWLPWLARRLSMQMAN